MANLNLTGQNTANNKFKGAIVSFKTQLEKRKAIWDRLPTANRGEWRKSGNDPITETAFKLCKYLNSHFGLKVNYGDN